MDKDSMKKVIYKLSAFYKFYFNTWSLITLLDFATFIHIFNIKERLSNFKKALKGQCLLYSSNVTFIEKQD